MCRFPRNLESSTSWNLQGLNLPEQGLFYLHLSVTEFIYRLVRRDDEHELGADILNISKESRNLFDDQGCAWRGSIITKDRSKCNHYMSWSPKSVPFYKSLPDFSLTLGQPWVPKKRLGYWYKHTAKLKGRFSSQTELHVIFFTWFQASVPLGTDHCSSEEYRCTHLDACVARTWISYRCVPCHPWSTNRTSLVVKKTFFQFSCGCEQFH
jgi:hypothetical protein